VQQRLPSLLSEPILFAHRGASAYAPENTLDAFSLALKLGANGLESDIWVTRDGVLVLDHDGVVKSRLRSKPIAEMDRSALPSHIPSLEQLLQHCGTQYQLSLDVKDPVVFETIERTVANIDDIVRVVRVVGYVNGVAGFINPPVVVNGASELFVHIWGEAGKHARSAIGVADLPLDAPVEIELTVELKA